MDKLLEKIESISTCFSNIVDSHDFATLIDDIEKTAEFNKMPIFIFAGVGKNWYICEKEVKTFISMGLPAKALDPVHALHGDLGMLTNADELKIIIFVSKSGTTEELISLAKVVHSMKDKDIVKNTATALLCLNPIIKYNEEICKLFDYMLCPSVSIHIDTCYMELDDRNLIPSLSICTNQLLLDHIGVTIFQKSQELMDKYKYHHIAGSNGKKLGMSPELFTKES